MSTGEPMQSLFTINASEDVEQARRLAKYIERLPNVRATLSGNVPFLLETPLSAS